MARKPTPPPIPDSRAELLLAQSARLLAPLVRLLVQNGAGFTQLAAALKQVFIEEARRELAERDRPVTDAAVSLLSGVHRKEVRMNTAARDPDGSIEPATAQQRALSFAEQIFTRWQTDAAYRDAHGRPATLPIAGAAPSFDALAVSITRDFSRRTILDELIRLGLVREEDDTVVPIGEAMVPTKGLSELAKYLADHVHDHLAAGAANVQAVADGGTAPFLEHSMYASGLTDSSIEQLANLAKAAWKPAFNQMVDAATQRYAVDKKQKARGRMRFGVYFYSEGAAPKSRATGRAPRSKKS